MLLSNPEKFENFVLDEINHMISLSEMSYVDRCFLNGVIRQLKPKKIVEIGIAAGGSSAIILNAIKDIDNSILYSIDYNTQYYRDTNKKSGFIVDKYFSNLKDKWVLYTGGVAAKFIEKIGSNIDVCLIDTMHCNPGEFLDFLSVLPFLKENATVILHDTALYGIGHVYNNAATTNGILLSCLKGLKVTTNEGYYGSFGNIAAITLDSDIKERIFDYFYLLTFPWSYIPQDSDLLDFKELFKKYYSEEINMIYDGIVSYHREKITNIEYYNKLEKIVNKIAWFIPIRRLRDKFRQYYLSKRLKN